MQLMLHHLLGIFSARPLVYTLEAASFRQIGMHLALIHRQQQLLHSHLLLNLPSQPSL